METARIAQIIDEMGTLLEIKGENPFRCRAYHTAAQSLGHLPADLREMIARRELERGAGHRRDDVFQDRAACDDGPTCVVRRAEARHAAGAGGALADTRAGPEEDQGAARRAQDRQPGGPAGGGESGKIATMKGFGEKTQANILAGINFVEKVERADLAEHGAAAGGADRRAAARAIAT